MARIKAVEEKKTNWLAYSAMAAAAIIALAVGYAVLGGAAGPNPDEGVRVSRDGDSYTARFIEDGTVERWKYVIREDPVCNGDHFTDSGRGVEGNLGEVVYGSDTFTPTQQQLTDYDYKFVCFNALLTGGGWAQGGRQLLFNSNHDNDEEGEEGDEPAPIPYMWDTHCLTEDSDWEGTAPEDAWCEEGDSRVPLAGNNTGLVSFSKGRFGPGSPAELTGYLHGYLYGATDDNDGLVWQNMYEDFERFVYSSGAAPIACYDGDGDDWSNLYETAVNDEAGEHIPSELRGYVIERFNPQFQSLYSEEGIYTVLLQHQIVSQSAGSVDGVAMFRICKYDVIKVSRSSYDYF